MACDDSPAARVILHGDEAEVEAARKAMEEEVARRKWGKKKGKSSLNGNNKEQQHGLMSNGTSSTAGTASAAAGAAAVGAGHSMDAGYAETKKTREEGSKKGTSPPSGRDKSLREDDRERSREGEASSKRVGVGIHLHQRPDGTRDGPNGGMIVGGKPEDGLVAKKRKNEESGSGSDTKRKQHQYHEQKERPKGSDLVRVEHKWKAGEHVPQGATSSVYKSIFTSSSANQQKETYSCRSLPLGRF